MALHLEKALRWPLLAWAGGGLVANLLWEVLQRPLYAGYRDPGTHLLGCFIASLGDAAIVIGLYLLVSLVTRDLAWIRRPTLARLLLLGLAGVSVAVALELRGLGSGRWSYGPGMPLIPGLEIGWVPVLQMVLIPWGLVLLSRTALTLHRPGDRAR